MTRPTSQIIKTFPLIEDLGESEYRSLWGATNTDPLLDITIEHDPDYITMTFSTTIHYGIFAISDKLKTCYNLWKNNCHQVQAGFSPHVDGVLDITAALTQASGILDRTGSEWLNSNDRASQPRFPGYGIMIVGNYGNGHHLLVRCGCGSCDLEVDIVREKDVTNVNFGVTLSYPVDNSRVYQAHPYFQWWESLKAKMKASANVLFKGYIIAELGILFTNRRAAQDVISGLNKVVFP